MDSTHPELRQLLRDLLDVMDNLERALQSFDRGEAPGDSVVEGVRGIHRQLLDLLYRYDVRGFSSAGAPFDPARHEAMGQLRSEDLPPNHIMEEIRRGYLIGDKLFRAAQVLVSTGPTGQFEASKPGGRRVRRPTSRARPDRSAASRPAWLLNPPRSTRERLYTVGQISAAPDVETGKERACDLAVSNLIGVLIDLLDDDALERTFRKLVERLERKEGRGLWHRLCGSIPEAERWIEDVYWERVKGEIRGTVYDVAVLIGLPAVRGRALVRGQDTRERWGGLVLADLGPLLEALTGGTRGGLVVETQLGGMGTRAGFQPGDVVTKVGNRPTEDAASARRLLTLAGNGRRPFDVEYIRGLGQPQIMRVETSRR